MTCWGGLEQEPWCDKKGGGGSGGDGGGGCGGGGLCPKILSKPGLSR